jgi:hypothetical protein
VTINYCRGCSISVPFLVRCSLGTHNDKGHCPCTNCIIKPICQIGCESLKLFELTIYDPHTENKK